jgi:hypothetical protein
MGCTAWVSATGPITFTSNCGRSAGAGIASIIVAKWMRVEVARAMRDPLVEGGGAERLRASAAKGAALCR